MLSFLNPSNAVTYLKDLIWGAPVCHAGDIACELSDGKYQLPSYLSAFFAKAEEYTGVSKYISGPVAAGLVGVVGVSYLYRRYQAKDAMELINNILKKEFGPLASEIFEAFKKAVETSIDKAIEDMLSSFKGGAKMNDKELANAKAKLRESKLQAIQPTLAALVKENKAAIQQAAELAKKPFNASTSTVLPGEKAATSPKVALSALMGQLLFPRATSRASVKL